MNLTLKRLIIFVAAVVSVSPLIAKLVEAQTVPLPPPVPSDIPVPPQPVRLPANKGLPTERFLGKEHYQTRMTSGAMLQSVEFMTYQEYMSKYGDGASVPSDVSPDRMVSVLTVDFPNGLKAENADYSQARVISARDAETSEYLSHITVGNITLQKGPAAQP